MTTKGKNEFPLISLIVHSSTSQTSAFKPSAIGETDSVIIQDDAVIFAVVSVPYKGYEFFIKHKLWNYTISTLLRQWNICCQDLFNRGMATSSLDPLTVQF